MPIYPESTRLDELARLGLSRPLIRLAAGELIHPLFDPRFVGPPDYVYGRAEDAISVPDGPPLVPLWSFADGVQGVWEVGDCRLDFIDYGVEDPDEFQIVAHTEQGFLAWMFIQLHEDNFDYPDDLSRLHDAAEIVGFRHYSEWLETYETTDEDNFDQVAVALVERIDALKTSRDRRCT